MELSLFEAVNKNSNKNKENNKV